MVTCKVGTKHKRWPMLSSKEKCAKEFKNLSSKRRQKWLRWKRPPSKSRSPSSNSDRKCPVWRSKSLCSKTKLTSRQTLTKSSNSRKWGLFRSTKKVWRPLAQRSKKFRWNRTVGLAQKMQIRSQKSAVTTRKNAAENEALRGVSTQGGVKECVQVTQLHLAPFDPQMTPPSLQQIIPTILMSSFLGRNQISCWADLFRQICPLKLPKSSTFPISAAITTINSKVSPPIWKTNWIVWNRWWPSFRSLQKNRRIRKSRFTRLSCPIKTRWVTLIFVPTKSWPIISYEVVSLCRRQTTCLMTLTEP